MREKIRRLAEVLAKQPYSGLSMSPEKGVAVPLRLKRAKTYDDGLDIIYTLTLIDPSGTIYEVGSLMCEKNLSRARATSKRRTMLRWSYKLEINETPVTNAYTGPASGPRYMDTIVDIGEYALKPQFEVIV